MTTATLASDSAVSLSASRLPAWLPRMLAQAGGVLRQPAKWPFSSGLSRGRVPAPLQPAAVPVQPSLPARAARPAVPAQSAPAVAIETQAAHSQSLGTVAQAAQTVTLRQMVVDILLVAMWGALIPGLMWVGAAAGF